MNTRPTLALLPALVLAACTTVGSDYRRPEPATPPAAQYKELDGWTQAAPADAAPKGDWWTGFHDPLLDALEPQVHVSNQTVLADAANYRQALALVRAANAALYPTVGVTGSATRARSATSVPGSTAAAVVNQGTLEATASWSPDLWGSVRRQIEESAANAQSSEATLANETLSAQVALANAVVNLRATDADIDLLTRTVDAYTEYLRVVANAVGSGYKLYAPSDLLQARVQLENTQASLINLGVARAQYAHAIAVLVGKTPEELDIAHSTALPALPSIPVGVPSTLLQRRPDIAAAERTMAAQNAAVGVAVAAYYPDVSLSGVLGFSQAPLAGLLRAANEVWSLGASATETLIDFGARRAQVDAAKAAYDAAVATYRGTVLSAFQGVEDNLASLRILAQQAQVLDQAVADATRASEVARNEYAAGLVDYTTVATAQTSELSARQSALGVQQSRLVAAVTLIGALGGGWSAGQLHDAGGPAAAASDAQIASRLQP